MAELFPYRPRPVQERMLDDVRRTVRQGEHLVLEAPTGSGKTAAVLAPCVAAWRDAGRRVLYLTRTNSQQTQVVRELAAISDRVDAPVRVAPLQGRTHLCTLRETHPVLGRADAGELGTLCRDRQALTARLHPRPADEGSCSAYAGWLDGADDLLDWTRRATPTAEEIRERARDRGVCPYETVRELASEAAVVTAPFVYLFRPALRRVLLGWMDADLDDLIVVVDEAHNLPDHVRELASDRLSRTTIERATREAEEHDDPRVLEDATASELCRLVACEVEEIANVHADTDEDALLPPDAVREALMVRFQATDRRLREAFDRLVAVGTAIRERRRRAGELPRSHLAKVGRFLATWFAERDALVARIVESEPNPALRTACLDPTRHTRVLEDVHASLHVSGTLADPAAYRTTVGLETARTRRLTWPRLEERLRVVYDRTVTTRRAVLERDDGMLDELHRRVDAILEAAPVSAMVAFPSFALLQTFVDRGLEGDLVEDPRMDQAELHGRLAAFRQGTAGRMLVVAGGRLCEGIDLPGSELELVVHVGIPYPAPDAVRTAMKRLHDARGRDGFHRAIHVPAARRLRQTVGRLVRGPEDRGVAAILDARADRFRSVLPSPTSVRDPAKAVSRALRSLPG